MIKHDHKYMVIGPDSWGMGETEKVALKHAQHFSKKGDFKTYLVPVSAVRNQDGTVPAYPDCSECLKEE